jgi:hypothetical protein
MTELISVTATGPTVASALANAQKPLPDGWNAGWLYTMTEYRMDTKAYRVAIVVTP